MPRTPGGGDRLHPSGRRARPRSHEQVAKENAGSLARRLRAQLTNPKSQLSEERRLELLDDYFVARKKFESL